MHGFTVLLMSLYETKQPNFGLSNTIYLTLKNLVMNSKKVLIESTSATFGNFKFITDRKKISELFICKMIWTLCGETITTSQVKLTSDNFINIDFKGENVLLIVQNIKEF